MKRSFIIPFVIVIQLAGYGQHDYWQQELNYHIKVTLDDEAKKLTGTIDLVYSNNSPDSLNYIWFHLWPNGYRDNSTALFKQLQSSDSQYSIDSKNQGYIDQLNFTVDGLSAQTESDPDHIDMLKLVLNSPLAPGKQVKIHSPFAVKLPAYFSRSGYSGQQFMICQWYPKPAVYDHKGWHPIPYLDQGEFYSEFGNYQVEITLPSAYVVGATGQLITSEEYLTYTSIGAQNQKNKGLGKPKMYQPKNPASRKTLLYTAERVHDFAWFADKDFIIRYDTLMLPSGKIIDAFTFGQPNGNRHWKQSVDFVEDVVSKYSSWIGEYPYPTAQAVEGPKNNSSGGMEYPMITLITSPRAGKEELDAIIAHEVGHNWFYAILASNEREHPWMDEGIDTYYQFRYEAEKYHTSYFFGDAIPRNIKYLPVNEFQTILYESLNNLPANAPVMSSSTELQSKGEYGQVAYMKASIWLFKLEKELGRPALDKAMQSYFQRWKFKHPYPVDLKEELEKSTSKDLINLFSLLHKQGNF